MSLGLGADDDDVNEDDEGLGVKDVLGLLVDEPDSRDIGLGMRPELRLDLELLWRSEVGLFFGVEVEAGLGAEVALDLGAADDAPMLGLDSCLLVLGLTVLLRLTLLFSLSLRWLL